MHPEMDEELRIRLMHPNIEGGWVIALALQNGLELMCSKMDGFSIKSMSLDEWGHHLGDGWDWDESLHTPSAL